MKTLKINKTISFIVLMLVSFSSYSTPIEYAYTRTNFNEEAKTIGQAASHYIEPFGYKLVVGYPAPTDAMDILKKRIPLRAKFDKQMLVLEALQLLVGQKTDVVIDHDNKLISFTRIKI